MNLSIYALVISFIIVLLLIFSEIWIAKDSKDINYINTPIWLIINLLLPFIGLLLYIINKKALEK